MDHVHDGNAHQGVDLRGAGEEVARSQEHGVVAAAAGLQPLQQPGHDVHRGDGRRVVLASRSAISRLKFLD
eukprot:COSAG06_NODE_17023_length_966_cov_1.100346_1_plen_71_part_00